MSVFRPVYHNLATGRHINEVVAGLLLIALIFDGYAIIAGALAFCHWLKRSARKAGQDLAASKLKTPETAVSRPDAMRAEILQP